MNWLLVVQLLVSWTGTIKGILDRANTNASVVTMIMSLAKPVAGILEQIGDMLFPEVKKELRVAAAAMATFDPDITKWLQGALNKVLVLDPPLEVDGVYGPLTRAAVKRFQTENGIAVIDGWAGRITQGVLDTLLAKG